MDDLGTISEVVSVDEQGLPNKVKVVNYAVFERSVRDNDEWRLCKV